MIDSNYMTVINHIYNARSALDLWSIAWQIHNVKRVCDACVWVSVMNEFRRKVCDIKSYEIVHFSCVGILFLFFLIFIFQVISIYTHKTTWEKRERHTQRTCQTRKESCRWALLAWKLQSSSSSIFICRRFETTNNRNTNLNCYTFHDQFHLQWAKKVEK